MATDDAIKATNSMNMQTSVSAAHSKKHSVDLQEVQETVSRLAAHKGVLAVLILNRSGDIVTQSGGGDGVVGNPKLLAKMLEAAKVYVSSMPDHQEEETQMPGGESEMDGNKGVEALLQAAKMPTNENVSFLRLRTLKHEILVAPKFGFTLVVLQDPSDPTL